MKNKVLFMVFFFVVSIINSVFAATWWDAKNVQRLEDGCIEYSLQVNNYFDRKTGNEFSGIVVIL